MSALHLLLLWHEGVFPSLVHCRVLTSMEETVWQPQLRAWILDWDCMSSYPGWLLILSKWFSPFSIQSIPMEGASPVKQLLDCLCTTPCKSIAPDATHSAALEKIKELSAPFSSREQFIRLQFSLGTTNGYNNGNDTLVFCQIMEMEASILSIVQFSFLDWITLIGFHQCFSNLPVHQNPLGAFSKSPCLARPQPRSVKSESWGEVESVGPGHQMILMCNQCWESLA